MVCILATLRVQNGKQDEFERVFGTLAEAVRANEPGNAFYQLCRDDADDTVYVVMEGYEDAAAIEAHRSSAHYQAATKELGAVLAAAPEIKILPGVG